MANSPESLKTTFIQCPVRGPLPFFACPPDEVDPLIEHLRSNVSVDVPVTFPRGTVLPDGRLDLCKQSLGPEGCQRVVDALHHNHHVRSLLLGTDGIGDEGAACLSRFLKSDAALQIVYLGCNGITHVGARSLAESLRSNQCVQGLWLKRNPIGDLGVVEITRALSGDRTLRVLDLVNTGMGRNGVASICQWLMRDGCALERLYVGGNRLDADAAKLFAEVLCRNSPLQSLHMNVGAICDSGVTAIAESLRSNHSLRELGLASNGITARGARRLMAVVAEHPTLVHLDLGYSPSTRVLGAQPNTLGDEGGKAIAEMLTTNLVLKELNLSKTSVERSGRLAIENALVENRTLQRCVIDGGLSPSVQMHLQGNLRSDNGPNTRSPDVMLIRSVYRTNKK
ncbi:leucine-rich repeat domain-containing protein [Stieleria varia]|uniref:Leucine Rich repeats (2 copies) n=1 Tax=Stieleria varia TaxID=2528005 RepID=A0A5C6B9W7_9BACT|nr:ribonuclease inhibitor [Stieleria varia]TWU08056.1 Leucine Rich repeats (2 copies) [Stieleria varia]